MSRRSAQAHAPRLAPAVIIGLAMSLFVLPAAAKPYDHQALDTIVKAAVKGRLVDYDKVAAKRPALQKYIAGIEAAKTEGMPRLEKMAFYTNAYNAIVLEQVLVHKRPASVLKVPGFFDKVKHTVAGEQLTLNELEEKKLRSQGDPRIHFVVNCASDDCPPLAPFAYTGKDYTRQLERQTKAYLSRKGEVVVDDVAKTVQVVQLFEWYQGDWGDEAKARAFIGRYVPGAAEKLADPSYKLVFRPYDWDLNKTR